MTLQIRTTQTRQWHIALALLLAIPLSLIASDRVLRTRERTQQPSHQYCSAHQTVDWLRRGSGGMF